MTVHYTREGPVAWLTIDRRNRVFEPGRVGHVAHDVTGQQLEPVRRAVRETLAERGEELVELPLAVRVAPRTQDAHGLIAGPDRPPGCRVAVVQRELRLVQRGLDPRTKILQVRHVLMMLPGLCTQGLSDKQRRPVLRDPHLI